MSSTSASTGHPLAVLVLMAGSAQTGAIPQRFVAKAGIRPVMHVKPPASATLRTAVVIAPQDLPSILAPLGGLEMLLIGTTAVIHQNLRGSADRRSALGGSHRCCGEPI